jgi:hypothetical protein
MWADEDVEAVQEAYEAALLRQRREEMMSNSLYQSLFRPKAAAIPGCTAPPTVRGSPARGGCVPAGHSKQILKLYCVRVAGTGRPRW